MYGKSLTLVVALMSVGTGLLLMVGLGILMIGLGAVAGLAA